MPPPTPSVPVARFDDLRTGECLQFSQATRVVTAWTPDEVVPALRQVEAAVDAGNWAFGMLAHEAAPGLDPLLVTHDAPEGLPLVWFGIAGAPDDAAPPLDALPVPPDLAGWHLTPDWTRDQHAGRVAGVQDAIAAGTTYQANLTTRFRGRLPDAPGDTHPSNTRPSNTRPSNNAHDRSMRDRIDRDHMERAQRVGELYGVHALLARRQQGSHHAFLDTGRHVVASASPECFLDWRGDELVSRPMKGTMPRGRTAADDERNRRALVESTKDAAENVMIVDLIRNDLSRVAQTGSVRVESLLDCEQYPTVWQLVSAIACRTRPDVGLVEVFEALFPCGSITGAPKQATMRVLAGLEDSPRGVYCGAIGFVQPAGAGPRRASFSVAIRTLVLDTATGVLEYGAGGAITWDSLADAEYDELLAKAAVLGPLAGSPVADADHLCLPPDASLIETFAVHEGTPVHLLQHLDRLQGSARALGVRCDRAAIADAVASRLSGLRGDHLVRVRLLGDGTFEVQPRPLAPAPGPVRVALDEHPVASSVFSAHKTSLRAHFDRARERHPDADDVVLVNEHGQVTETTTANLAALIDGQWCTPPVADGCLPGVGRALALARGELRERSLTPDELRAADALALVSSARGWRDAHLLPASDAGRAGAPDIAPDGCPT